MPRPKLIRKVSKFPHFKGFRPIGKEKSDHTVVLNFEEYEAIRLSDYEMLGQHCASREMGVSRSTYARIYDSARRKIAEAFILGEPWCLRGVKYIWTASGTGAMPADVFSTFTIRVRLRDVHFADQRRLMSMFRRLMSTHRNRMNVFRESGGIAIQAA